MPGKLKDIIKGNVNFTLFLSNLLVIVPSIKQKVACKYLNHNKLRTTSLTFTSDFQSISSI